VKAAGIDPEKLIVGERLIFEAENARDGRIRASNVRGRAEGEGQMIEWFDDLALGMRFKSGMVQVTEDGIKKFASEFDPQPFHLDDAAAQKTMFKGLAASGWHTAAIAMNLAIQTRPFGNHPLIGLGVDGLRWMAPVRPGDVLHIEGEVISLTPSRTKPQGIALVKWTVYNQRSEAVYTFTPIAIVPRRPDPDS
jgi:acyl dehydratase